MNINKNRLVKTFVDLVKIDSESGEEQKIIKYLQKIMIGFKFKAEIDKTGNLICSNSKTPKLMLAAHVDTVMPGRNINPIIKGNIVKTDGTTILGGDDKSNVAIILEILNVLKENNINVPLNIVFTISEEVNLSGSKGLDYSKIKAKIGLNLDGSLGKIDIAEPSIMRFDIEVFGKAAHAGMCPEKGVNAIKIAAEAIHLIDLGRIDNETTTNVGTIQGGTVVNSVPDKVLIKAEVRSRNNKKFKHHVDIMLNAFKQSAKKYGGKVKIISKQTAFAYKLKENNKLIEILKNSFKRNGIKTELVEINGATDNNNFSRNGITCVTTGGMGQNIHTTNEYLEIDKFTLAATSILSSILSIAKN
jgi:tripeptide aminopeptidase